MTEWRELYRRTRDEVGDPVARWLCEEASGADPAGGLESVLGESATPRMAAHLDAMVARYCSGEPLAYVLGHWSFRHLDLAVDRRVLIPRPETEVVAGVAIELARGLGFPLTVADLGTGSGAIGLALADELPLDGVTVWMTDASREALAVAGANLAGLGHRGRNVRLASGPWFDALPAGTTLDLAVANPPYIADDSPDVEAGVRDWEPPAALFAGSGWARRDPGHRRRCPALDPLRWRARPGDRSRPGGGRRRSALDVRFPSGRGASRPHRPRPRRRRPPPLTLHLGKIRRGCRHASSPNCRLTLIFPRSSGMRVSRSGRRCRRGDRSRRCSPSRRRW